MMKVTTNEISYADMSEQQASESLVQLLKNCPLPDNQLLPNLGLFLHSKAFSRLLYFFHIYQKIVDSQGIIVDFGTRWGQNMCLFAAFRSMLEPFNRHRKIVGFDTFEGFPNDSITEKDGVSDLICPGSVHTVDDYKDYLDKLMACHEKLNPLSHLKKYEIVKGDVCETLPKYLEENPHTIVALVYFDLDLYKPTKACLEAIYPFVTKGTVFGFDELNDQDSPGETIALRELLALSDIKIQRYRYCSRTSYFIIE